MTFGERLKKLRELAGLAQSELARRSGINRANINMLENGTRTGLTVVTARRLVRALNVTLDYLVGDSYPFRGALLGTRSEGKSGVPYAGNSRGLCTFPR